jgi:hypothetical protein
MGAVRCSPGSQFTEVWRKEAEMVTWQTLFDSIEMAMLYW